MVYCRFYKKNQYSTKCCVENQSIIFVVHLVLKLNNVSRNLLTMYIVDVYRMVTYNCII